MAKRKAKPQTTAELRKELRAHINPVIRLVNDHSDGFGRIADSVNRNADIIESVQKRLECVSADRMATQIDLEAEARRSDAIAHRVEGLRLELLLVVSDAVAGLRMADTHRDIAYLLAFESRGFWQRLRWLLTGK